MHVMHRVAVRYAMYKSRISGGDGIEESSSRLASTNGLRRLSLLLLLGSVEH